MIIPEIPKLIKAYETWLYEKSYQQSMEDLYADGVGKDQQEIDVKIKWVKEALRVMTGPTYELVMNIFTIINVFSVFLRSFMQNASASAINGWMIA